MKSKTSSKRNYDLSRTKPAAGTEGMAAGTGTANPTGRGMASGLNGHQGAQLDVGAGMSLYFKECLRLFLHPASASAEELQRPYGWISGLLNLVPSILFAIIMVGLLVFLSPAYLLTDSGPAVWAANSFLMVTGYVMMALLTLGTVHILSLLAGGKGEMKALWHLFTKTLVIFNPLWLVANLFGPVLPGLSVGTQRYALAQLAVDMCFLMLLAQMLPNIYQMSRKKSVLVGVLFWLLAMGMWLAVSYFMPASLAQ